MRVLIATPTYGNALHTATAESIAAQDTPGWEWRQYKVNRYPAPDSRNVLAQYAAIRADFLGGEWDALLTVEHDMVIPPHALRLLLATEAPVAYGVYLLRHGANVLNAWEYIGDHAMGESYTLRGAGPRTGVVRVSGVGNGCTLIRRAVVERLPFHDGGNPGQSPDVPFAQDCLRLGIPAVAHFDVQCGHYHEGRLLWPFRDEMDALRKIKCLASVTASVGGRSKRLEAGQEYEMPAPVARELARAGYVAVIDEEPEPTPAKRKRG